MKCHLHRVPAALAPHAVPWLPPNPHPHNAARGRTFTSVVVGLSGNDRDAQKYEISWERLEITQCIRVPVGEGLWQPEPNPVLDSREALGGLCDDNPQQKPRAQPPGFHSGS